MASRRSPRSRLLERRIRSKADFHWLRGMIGRWGELLHHPDYLAMLVAGAQSGLFGNLTQSEVDELAKAVVGLRIRRGPPLRHCVNFAYLSNALARCVRDFPAHGELLGQLYLAKARWVEQAVLRAREDGDSRLSWRRDGWPDALVFDFTDLLSGRGEAVTLGFHMPVWQIHRDTPHLAAILFGS